MFTLVGKSTKGERLTLMGWRNFPTVSRSLAVSLYGSYVRAQSPSATLRSSHADLITFIVSFYFRSTLHPL